MAHESESFDQGLERLERVAQQLEAGALTLEDALQAFEEGMALTRTLQQQLADAQRRIEVLRQGLDGEYRTDPMEGDAL